MSNQIKTLHIQSVLKRHRLDMTGKVVAITGITSGTGFITAREIEEKGAQVILLNRKSEHLNAAFNDLKTAAPEGKFEAITCDLQSFINVNAAIENNCR
ncbi:SDR family NAD(P)-dependent oxidoreductase [bacterium]|nr:SDR family NAD(P)-dependent oxidoreductase [bacterium]